MGGIIKFDVTDIKMDDDLPVSRKVVRLGSSGNVKFETPMKPSVRTMTNASPVHEICRHIKPQTLDQCAKSQSYDARTLQSLQSQCDDSCLNIFHISFDGKNTLPTESQIKQLADLQYMSSDVVVMPSWFTTIDKQSDPVDKFLRLSDTYHKYASFRNHKPVMATIPVCISADNLSRVIDHFINMDITSFVIDFNSRHLTKTTWVRSFMRTLQEYNVSKEGIVYSINASQGIVRKTDGVRCEAHDFLGFGAGIDLLGNKYSAKKSAEMYESTTNSVKIFDPANYTYVSQKCSDKELWRYKSISAMKQIDELGIIRETIKHDESILDMIKTKKLSESTMTWLKIQNKTEPRKTALDDFF